MLARILPSHHLIIYVYINRLLLTHPSFTFSPSIFYAITAWNWYISYQRTFLEILKSSNAQRFFNSGSCLLLSFRKERLCRSPGRETNIFYNCDYTENYLSSLYAYFIIYMREMQERSRVNFCMREWHLTLLEVLRNNSRKCMHTHRTQELLHVTKLCRQRSRILVSSRTGRTCDLSELHPGRYKISFASLIDYMPWNNRAIYSYFITIQLLYAVLNNEIISRAFSSLTLLSSYKRREGNNLMKITSSIYTTLML